MPELHEHNWHEIDEYYDECVICGATRHTYDDDDQTDDLDNPPDYEIPSPREPGVRYWDEIGLDDDN